MKPNSFREEEILLSQCRSRSGSCTREQALIALSGLLFQGVFYYIKIILPLYITSTGGSDYVVAAGVAAISGAGLISRWVTGTLQDVYGSRQFLIGSAVGLTLVAIGYYSLESLSAILILCAGQGIMLGAFDTAAVGHLLVGEDSEAARASALSFYSMSRLVALAAAPWISLSIAEAMDPRIALGFSGMVAAVCVLPLLGLRHSSRKTSAAEGRKGRLAFVLGLAKDRVFAGASILYFSWAFTYGAIYSFLPLYGKELGLANVGSFFAAYAAVTAAARAFVGPLMSQVGSHLLINLSSIVVVVSMMVLALAQSITVLSVAGLLYGMGSFAMYPCLTSLATGQAQGGIGTAFALFMFSFELGQLAGPIVFARIANYWGYSVAYGGSAAVFVAGFGLYNVLARRFDGTGAPLVG